KLVSKQVGRTTDDVRNKYEGETLKLGLEINEALKKVLVYAGSEKEVYDEAFRLVHGGGAQAVKNHFLKRDFEKAIAMVRDQPVPFDPDSELRDVIQPEEGSEALLESLTRDARTFEPFAMSYDELQRRFDEAVTQVYNGVKKIETDEAGARKELEGL